MRAIIILLVALLGITAVSYGGWVLYQKSQTPVVSFRTATLKRGELLATISATGTVEPEEVVDVGAQIAGQIVSFGQDPHHAGKLIDYNTEVEENTVLAAIDDA